MTGHIQVFRETLKKIPVTITVDHLPPIPKGVFEVAGDIEQRSKID